MQPSKAFEHASALYRSHGPAADARVAERIRACETDGRTAEADDWKRVQHAIRELRGTREH